MAVSTGVMAVEDGGVRDFNNIHGEALSEYCVRIGGGAMDWGVAQRGLARWMQMVALELVKTKLAGEAGAYGAYAKRLIDEGYGTV